MYHNNRDPLNRKVAQRTFSTRFMRRAIFKHYINKFGTYVFITQIFLHGVRQSKRENAVTLPHIAQKNNVFWGEIKEMSKTKKLPSRNKIAL